MKLKTANVIADKVLAAGTRIVSFKYSDKDGTRTVRNVLLGSNRIVEGAPIWGKQVDRVRRMHKGKTFLMGLDNNEGREVRAFNVNGIKELKGIG